MAGYTLTRADERKLIGVNARLVAVVRLVAARGVHFTVAEGLRTKERQRWLFKQKKTKTLNSRHLIGRAVDCYPLGVKPAHRDWLREDFTELVQAAKTAAADLKVDLEFGYDWGWDAPHWEMKER